MKKQNELFKTELVPGKKGSGQLFEEEFSGGESGPVSCLTASPLRGRASISRPSMICRILENSRNGVNHSHSTAL